MSCSPSVRDTCMPESVSLFPSDLQVTRADLILHSLCLFELHGLYLFGKLAVLLLIYSAHMSQVRPYCLSRCTLT